MSFSNANVVGGPGQGAVLENKEGVSPFGEHTVVVGSGDGAKVGVVPEGEQGNVMTREVVVPVNLDAIEFVNLTNEEKLQILEWKGAEQIFNELGKRKTVCGVLYGCVNDGNKEFNGYYYPFSSERPQGTKLASTDEVEGFVDTLFEQNQKATAALKKAKEDGLSKERLFQAVVEVNKYIEILDDVIEKVACLYLSKKGDCLQQVSRVSSVDEPPGSEYELKCCVLSLRYGVKLFLNLFTQIWLNHQDSNDSFSLLPEELQPLVTLNACIKSVLAVINKAKDNYSKQAVFEAKNAFVELLNVLPKEWTGM